jgi:hypothetical protein
MEQANNDLHMYWDHRQVDKDWLNAVAPEFRVPFVERIKEIGNHEPWSDDQATWRVTIYDYPYQALDDHSFGSMPLNALRSVGYHFVDDRTPHIVMFAGLGQQSGIPWTLTFSHELLETLVDSQAETVVDPEPGKARYELEICDPVQFQSYPIHGVWVSNFVTPHWFDMPPQGAPSEADGVRYDFGGQLIGPRQRSLGGTRSLRLGGRDRSETLTGFGQVVKTH